MFSYCLVCYIADIGPQGIVPQSLIDHSWLKNKTNPINCLYLYFVSCVIISCSWPNSLSKLALKKQWNTYIVVVYFLTFLKIFTRVVTLPLNKTLTNEYYTCLHLFNWTNVTKVISVSRRKSKTQLTFYYLAYRFNAICLDNKAKLYNVRCWE